MLVAVLVFRTWVKRPGTHETVATPTSVTSFCGVLYLDGQVAAVADVLGVGRTARQGVRRVGRHGLHAARGRIPVES